MKLRRREFLQAAGILWLGSSLAQWLGSDRRSLDGIQALAATTGIKRALLIGINQYQHKGFQPLQGCLTDLELQRELLKYRFGFNPADIETLENRAATATAIETALTEYLFQDIKAGDTLVLHFSGYGMVRPDPSRSAPEPALAAVDAIAQPEGTLPLSQILSHWQPQSGSKLIIWLDSGFSPPLTPWITSLGVIPPKTMRPSPPQSPLKPPTLPAGVTLIQAGDIAAETVLDEGVSAGLLTQTLSQHLWATDPPVKIAVSLGLAADDLRRATGSESHLQLQSVNGKNYFPETSLQASAEAVIVDVNQDHKTLRLWLGGVPLGVLQAGGRARMSLSRDPGQPVIELQSATGRWGNGQYSSSTLDLTPGQGLQEVWRLLPRQLSLAIALDNHLEKIERIDAINALASLSYVTVPSGTDQPTDFIVAKNATTGGYGLQWPVGIFLANSCSPEGEAAKAAVRRLSQDFPGLLGNKILGLTVNPDSSQVGMGITLEKLTPQAQSQALSRLYTPRLLGQTPEDIKTDLALTHYDAPLTLATGEQIRYRIQNYGDRPLYLLLLAWDSSRGLVAIPWGTDSDTSPWQIMLASSLRTTVTPWTMQRPSQWLNTYVIASQSPFSQTLEALPTPTDQRPLVIAQSQAIAVATAILQDLHRESPSPDRYALDGRTWGTFCFTLRVV
ncbi:caspase family protein [Candidatus Synechococcus calcipolaris G9]|uniref:Caspase family protein n=1 Tax=Candidatus Synechococcus calcipolaris G9 TaxID=1497997 RepID=A0ABT6ETY5_9SYNE|nr:caspase family protein [Candidatus Synechococcus calcipolaris]MDG2989368.1 caspase family protein [Candidatus Synechococcus calcipolaris G9]